MATNEIRPAPLFCLLSIAMAALFFCTAAPVCAADAQTSILVIRPGGRDFTDAIKGMAGDLGNEASIATMIIDDRARGKDIDNAVMHYRPSLVVLMDNSAIKYYKIFQQGARDSLKNIPSIALMGILLGNAIAGVRNAQAISYEIPIVTSAVNLRSALGVPVRRIGVVHRELMRDLVERNRESCGRENLTIVTRCIPDKDAVMDRSIENALVDLLEKERVDALWVPNDNVLLTPRLITDAWVPEVHRHRTPVIVGIESLVEADLDFGTLAVLPDHVALGVQAAAMILTIKENGCKVQPGLVEQPLSVFKIINMRQAGRFFKAQEKNLTGIDKILK